MFKNKIAARLSLYFAVVLISFSIVMGGLFLSLFKEYTVTLHREELQTRASSIADTVLEFMQSNASGNQQGRTNATGGSMRGFGSYFKFLGDIAGGDVWLIDENRNLITSGAGNPAMSHNYEYADLPPNADTLINQVFQDKIVFSEDFSGLLSELTLTVGVPIKEGNQVVGVVLLHSPVNGTDKAIADGSKLLLISLGVALAAIFLLSLWLSKRFTDPIISKEAQDALRLEKVRRNFVANISHELKTPLTVLRGSLEALTDHIVTEPMKIEEYHQQMLNETLYLQRLVGDLLDLSKLQNADFVIEKENISLPEVLHEVVKSLSSIASAKNTKIMLQIDNTEYSLYGDYGRIRQMLMIILDNAIKFSPAESPVEVSLHGNELSIRDHGCGISEEELPHIFERFYKSRSEQNKTGTGLGLAIAKQIADRHDIQLLVKSEQGNGTVFNFLLPDIF